MTQLITSSDRREYFRIKNWVFVDYQLVSSIGEGSEKESSTNKHSLKIALLQELNQIEQESATYLQSLTDKQSQLGNYLLNMNTKMDVLTRFIIQSMDENGEGLTEVDISGGGIRFKTKKKIKIDQIIRLEIILLPECFALIAYGRVVNARKNDDDEYDISLVFVDLKESDRDAIIRHIFKLQAKQLRESRSQTS
ncbi:MAG: PilZ domain-containing protein [Gammaproteobacteria bacterium]|nr:PilZ domain-containing protein [Gammaproteobacteria bacterium]MDH5630431.1 PilZ domain-containing protein [Gammaproteobacteria bacterium]